MYLNFFKREYDLLSEACRCSRSVCFILKDNWDNPYNFFLLSSCCPSCPCCLIKNKKRSDFFRAKWAKSLETREYRGVSKDLKNGQFLLVLALTVLAHIFLHWLALALRLEVQASVAVEGGRASHFFLFVVHACLIFC